MTTKQPTTLTSIKPSETTTRIRLAIAEPSGPATLNESTVKAFIQRYSHHIQACLDGVISAADIPPLFWAESFIRSSPLGLKTGSLSDDEGGGVARRFEVAIASYRTNGMRKVHFDEVEVTVLDARHAVARVGWGLYRERGGKGGGDVAFGMSYFLRQGIGEEMKIFGEVKEDEVRSWDDGEVQEMGRS